MIDAILVPSPALKAAPTLDVKNDVSCVEVNAAGFTVAGVETDPLLP